MAHPESPPVALLPHLRRAKDLMDRAYVEDLDLAAVARAAGCSRYHFLRSFHAAYGETPGRYLTRRRIERAKDLLRATNLTVTEICCLVGFASLGSFSARFSQLVGVSPTAYRAESVRAGGPPPIPGCFVLMWTRPRNSQEAPPDRPPLGSET
jgi:AraC-like DNA-binding protein